MIRWYYLYQAETEVVKLNSLQLCSWVLLSFYCEWCCGVRPRIQHWMNSQMSKSAASAAAGTPTVRRFSCCQADCCSRQPVREMKTDRNRDRQSRQSEVKWARPAHNSRECTFFAATIWIVASLCLFSTLFWLALHRIESAGSYSLKKRRGERRKGGFWWQKEELGRKQCHSKHFLVVVLFADAMSSSDSSRWRAAFCLCCFLLFCSWLTFWLTNVLVC